MRITGVKVKINKMVWQDFWFALVTSIAAGKKYYPLLFIPAAILQLLQIYSPKGSGGLISIAFLPINFFISIGMASVAQCIFQYQREPNLGDLLVAFNRPGLFKRTLPALLLNIVPIILSTILSIVFSLLLLRLDPSWIVEQINNFWVLSCFSAIFIATMVVLLAFGILVQIFIFFLLFHDVPWRQALLLSARGFWRNFHLWILTNLPSLLLTIIGAALILLFNVKGIEILDNMQWLQIAKKYNGPLIAGMSVTVQIITILISPFFANIYYLLYQKSFFFPVPEQDLRNSEKLQPSNLQIT